MPPGIRIIRRGNYRPVPKLACEADAEVLLHLCRFRVSRDGEID
jgi:hypothetical protein